MLDEEELIKRRFKDLADKCYHNNHYTFTGFLSPADLSCFYEIERSLNYVEAEVWGGSDACERVMIRFGSEDVLGYEEAFPIDCLQIRPLLDKFADELSHRDVLGALMNLGIERTVIGDIYIRDNRVYVFCQSSMSDFVMENLTKIKHTTVMAQRITEIPALLAGEGREETIQVSSERIDGVVAKVCKLSRGDSVALFREKKIFLNGRLCENNSAMLKESDKITVRGFGRIELEHAAGLSRKGKINLVVRIWGR